MQIASVMNAQYAARVWRTARATRRNEAMTKPFDPSRPCTTRDGRPVRILCTDARGSRQIIGLINNGDEDTTCVWTSAGRLDGNFEHPCDLINVPTKRKGWIGIVVQQIQRCDGIIATSSHVYRSKDEAQRQTDFTTFIEIEFDE
jgi:hypothetical protein